MSNPKDTPAFVRRLLASMTSWNASDVFLNVGRPPAARVHGSVVAVDLPKMSDEDIEGIAAEVLSEDALARLRERGDIDAGYALPDGRRFRFNFGRQAGGLGAVIRALPRVDMEIVDLGLPAEVAQFADARRGLVLVTGATGSGKSTTLAAFVHHINRTRPAHIVTIEDPIEFVHDDLRARISQREVGVDTESFETALKHVVRQSPDVILIGELRDRETIETALTASLTGHLVFATVHTIDATQTIRRLLSYYPSDRRQQAAADLAMSLVGVVSQRLLPRADGSGRVLAAELLNVGPPARRLIREQRVEDLYDLMKASTDPTMRTFNEALLTLYTRGDIDYDSGVSWASNPEEFALAAQGMATGVSSFRGDDGEGAVGFDMKALLRTVQKRGASDLHLTVGRPPILRIAGQLVPLKVRPLTSADLRTLLYSIFSVSQRSTYELEREIDFALALDDGQRFRVNAYFQKGRMAASLRSIASTIPTAEQLRLPAIVTELGLRPQGLLLVVGPTGSGKSTTLACLLDRVNQTRNCRIITVEDPIEFTHEPKLATVDQREVHADTRSFAAALKYVLRQDPDVILVGEMRDLETIHAAVTAAETGHLVMATLHTNDAVQAIDRIIDVFPSHQQPQIRSQLSAALLGVISQRLLPCPHGGRVAAFEVLVATSAMRTLVRDGKMHQAQSVMEASLGEGMITMDRALKELLDAQLITYDEALRYARNPRALANERLTGAGRRLT